MLPAIQKDQTVEEFLFNTILYPDQTDAVKSMLLAIKGQVIDPTGMGKSMIANAICAINANRLEKDNQQGLFTFASPTKVLGSQLLVETMVVMAVCGITKVSYLTVNSDIEPVISRKTRRFLEKTLGMEIVVDRNTMSPKLINEAIERNKSAGYHTVISSTYHSMEQVLKACHIGKHRITCHINDEPQKLVTEQFEKLAEPMIDGNEVELVDMDEFSANISRYTDNCYSVTATPKHTHSVDGYGMQNEKRFGPVLFELSERNCYLLGRKVPPKIARMQGLGYQITSPESMGDFVKKTYQQFAKRWKIAKVLYDTKGTAQLRWFMESGEKQELIDSGVNVAHCDSANGYWINNNTYNDASAWKAELNDLDEDMPLVCLHVEMLVEGLDLPGFNSLMMMKTRTQSALKQLIGRIQRLLGIDRDMMGYGKDFIPMNLLDKKIAKKFEKAFALVSFNEYDKDVGAYAKTLITIMTNEYGMTKEEIADFNDYEGTNENDPNESGNEDDGPNNKNIKETIDFELFKADLVDINELYQTKKISKIEWAKRKIANAKFLTRAS